MSERLTHEIREEIENKMNKKSDEIKEELAALKGKVIEKIGEVKHPLNLALYQEIYKHIEAIEEKLKRVVDE